jgi:integrase
VSVRQNLRQFSGRRVSEARGLESRGYAHGRGLAPNSVRKIHATLHRAMRDAVRWGYLSRNPVDNADPPRTVDGESEAAKAWQVADLKKFLASAKDDRLYPLWLTLALTGLRRGEALGLLWQDLDLTGGRLVVRRSLVPVNAEVIVSEPKTRRGHRTVTLDPGTVAASSNWTSRYVLLITPSGVPGVISRTRVFPPPQTSAGGWPVLVTALAWLSASPQPLPRP